VIESPVTASGPAVTSLASGRRPPPRAVRLLLPVWGHRYVKQFLDYSLPTMLAPGNIPAIAARFPCTFVLLTSSADADFIAKHPAYRVLALVCNIEIQPIDDLITGDNYSTTITLAYERAVRAAGADMLDTVFFFLISDYLVADGSFNNVVARIVAGASGVLAGNFQIVQEDAAPEFYQEFEQDTLDLKIPARRLMKWALKHLHLMTTANTVNFPLSHTSHTNRLFWRVDEDTVIGRFYLMHMIAIRPDTSNFVIGASCDYSFIPEMCRSKAVDVLTDSDEYLVVEMQPCDHERKFLRMGPFDPAALARTLSEWTTARHRENVRATLVFHAGDLPAALPEVVVESDRFIALVDARLSKTPKPHRNHPYWLGAIAAHRRALSRLKRGIDPALDLQERDPHLAWSLPGLIQDLKGLVFGRPPHVRPWHPGWPDYKMLVDRLRSLLSQKPGPLLIVAQGLTAAKSLVSQIAPDVETVQIAELLDLDRREYLAMANKFRGCVILVNESEYRHCPELIERLLPLITDEGFLMLTAINVQAGTLYGEFAADFTFWAAQLNDFQGAVSSAHFIPVTPARALVLHSLLTLNKTVTDHPVWLPLLALPIGFLMLASYVANWRSLIVRSQATDLRAYSSLFMVLSPTGWSRLPEFTEKRGHWELRETERRLARSAKFAARDARHDRPVERSRGEAFLRGRGDANRH